MAHRIDGRPSPTGDELVRRAVAGLRRKHGPRPAGKTALVTASLVAICGRLHDRETAAARLAARVEALDGRPGAAAKRRRAAGELRAARAARAVALRARRDRALLLVGYAAALRRSELVALDLADLAETEHGLQVFIARSKTDQAALGDFLGIVHGHPAGTCTITCPVRAWTDWRDVLGAELAALGEQLHPEAPALRPLTRHGALGTPGQVDPHARLTGQSVALVVKAAVALLADPARHPPERYAGHSLRAGFATQAAAAGVPLDRIMRQTRTAASPSLFGATSALVRSGTITPAPPSACEVPRRDSGALWPA